MYTLQFNLAELRTLSANRALAILKDQVDLGKLSKREAFDIALDNEIEGPLRVRWAREIGLFEAGSLEGKFPAGYSGDQLRLVS